MNDQTTLAAEVARAFRDHGITAALTALIGGTMALIAAITRKAFTNEALLDRLDRELIADRDRIDRQRSEDRKADGDRLDRIETDIRSMRSSAADPTDRRTTSPPRPHPPPQWRVFHLEDPPCPP